MADRERLETRVVKRSDREAFGDDFRHLQQQARCSNCGVWGDVDAEQARGAVSLICPECGWYGYIGGEAVQEPPADGGDGQPSSTSSTMHHEESADAA